MNNFIIKDDIKYYYRNEEHMKTALAGGGMKIMHMAEAAINVKTNEVLKCRYTMEQIFDNLDLDNVENIMLKQSMTHFKLAAMTGLILHICDNLGDMPISEEWAAKMYDKIMATVNMPEPTENTEKYEELSIKLMDAQEADDEKAEEELLDQLDIIWWKMRPDERNTCEIIISKLLADREAKSNK